MSNPIINNKHTYKITPPKRIDYPFQSNCTISFIWSLRHCKKCGWIWGFSTWKFCPYCGAKLDE